MFTKVKCKRAAKIFIILLLIVVLDSAIIETNFIKVNSYRLKGKWQGSYRPIKVVQFSDVHLGKTYGVRDLKKIVNKINQLNPDVIVCTGDLLDSAPDVSHREEIIAELKRLNAPYGKYAVYGNHEYRNDGDSVYRHMMRKAEFNLLVNEASEITIEGKQFTIVGLDDWFSGKMNITVATKELTESSYNILLVHEPDIVEELLDFPIDLQLSGHSHGGQFRLPVLGELYTPQMAKKYVKGMYHFSDNPIVLYVNVGTGTTIIRGRFFNRPEISEFIISND